MSESRGKSKKQSTSRSSTSRKQPVSKNTDAPWTKQEERFLRTLRRPHLVQEYLDQIPYRCEDEFPPPTKVLRDGKAHCYDGAMFAAAALRRTVLDVALVNLRAQRDDDHLLCVYRVGQFFGSVAKSNFPGLRSREPIYRSLRELVMSYFELYCNLEREKSLRGYSTPVSVTSSRLDTKWEWSTEAVDALGDRLVLRHHVPLLSVSQDRSLRLMDDRLFKSQMVGVDFEGAYGGKGKTNN